MQGKSLSILGCATGRGRIDTPRPPLRVAAFLAAAALAVLAIACSSSTTNPAADAGGSSAADAATAVDAATDTSCEATYAKSQTLSQPCCTGWGADACGALLFCAALDGRAQTTCYPEGSRKGGETCAANSWCASRECAADGKCRFTVGETCNSATGCTSVKSVPYGCSASGACKPCDATATDPRCPVACKGQDAEWSSGSCRLCESSACCTQLAACTSDNGSCAAKANTMLSCGPSFQSCLGVAFNGQLDATSAALKQCFTNALTSCAAVCP